MAVNTLLKSVVDAIGRKRCRIVPSNRSSLEVVMSVVRDPVGVFGVPPQYTPEGGIYVEPGDSRVVAEFKFWAAPVNQALVCQHGATERLTGFTMVISAMVSESDLESTYDDVDTDCGYFDENICLPQLPKWVTRFGWIYVPMHGDDDIALFFASAQNDMLIEDLDLALKMKGIDSLPTVALGRL